MVYCLGAYQVYSPPDESRCLKQSPLDGDIRGQRVKKCVSNILLYNAIFEEWLHQSFGNSFRQPKEWHHLLVGAIIHSVKSGTTSQLVTIGDSPKSGTTSQLVLVYKACEP